jgi:hypothetical protein
MFNPVSRFPVLRFGSPVDPDETTLVVVMPIQFALVSATHRFPNVPGQMAVSGMDDHHLTPFRDGHDAMKRVFGVFDLFKVAGEIKNFKFVFLDCPSFQGHLARGIMRPRTPASLAQFRMRVQRPMLSPFPPAAPVDRMADRANYGASQFAPGVIEIVDLVVTPSIDSW